MKAATAPTFNPAVAALAPPPVPLVQSWRAAYDDAHGPHGALIDLSQAVPGYPPHPDLLGWLGEAAGSTQSAGYGDIEGETDLRTAYARELTGLYDANVPSSAIHITSGCNQAFTVAAMAVAGPGDRVAMTNPCYFNHAASLAMLGIDVGYVDCLARDDFLPSPGSIAGALTPGVRALALVTPNNPTGAVYPPALLDEIFALCAGREIWLIIDETYRDFREPGAGAPHRLFQAPGWEKTLIQLYSFSKSYCIPGHRVGAITAGGEAISQIAKVMDNLQICAPRAPQAALTRALPALTGWRAANAKEIAARAQAFRAALDQTPAWHLAAIGAYFAYVRHPAADRAASDVAEELARRLGVLTIPGDFFGQRQEGFLRFALANANVDVIQGLAGRLNAW